jgi:hypothetical protein
MSALDSLLAVIGPCITTDVAKRLLDEARGSVEEAIALFFTRQPFPSPRGAGQRGTTEHKLQQLRQIVGNRISTQRLTTLLGRHNGSVEAVVDAHFNGAEDGMDADPAGHSEYDVVIIGRHVLISSLVSHLHQWSPLAGFDSTSQTKLRSHCIDILTVAPRPDTTSRIAL